MAKEKEGSHRGMAGGGGRNMTGLISPKIKARDTRRVIRRLWLYLSSENKQLFVVFIMVILSTILSLAGPYLIGLAIDSIGLGTMYVNFPRLRAIILLMLTAYILSALIAWLQMHLMVSVAQKTVKKIRRDVFQKIQTLPLDFFESKTHGELMSRLTNDVENINHSLTQSTIQLFSSAITVSSIIVIMLIINPFLAFLSFVTIPIGIFITTTIAKRTRNYFGEQQKELGNLNGHIEESITGLKVIKAFGQEEQSIEKFNEINKRLRKSSIKAQIYSGIILPLMNISNNLSFALLAGVGGVMGVRGMISVGTIAMFLNYSRLFTRPITEIANQFNMIQSAIAGAERVFEVLDEVPEKLEEIDGINLEMIVGEVIFKDVSFNYKEEVCVLKDVSFTASPGQKIALVGETGAGKTTIANLLMRFYEVNKGEILIDGYSISNITRKSLRQSVSMVLQDTYLFAGTIMENIRYGRLEATDEEVMEAARLSKAEEFILRLPNAYNTMLTEEGSSLSQGQRQLLTIARAILANSKILILDEATSSVDTRTEIKIQQAMNELMKGRTSFIIAHRLSTIKDADQILLIDDGKIIERGTHDELLNNKGHYYNLYNIQFKNKAS